MDTLIAPDSPWDMIRIRITDLVRGSLGLPPIMRIA